MYNSKLLVKLKVLFQQILFNLAIATVAEANPKLISAGQVPSLHEVVYRYLKLVTSSNFWPFVLICPEFLHAIGHDHALLCADFHSICVCSVYESVCEVLKFTIGAALKIDVVGKL